MAAGIGSIFDQFYRCFGIAHPEAAFRGFDDGLGPIAIGRLDLRQRPGAGVGRGRSGHRYSRAMNEQEWSAWPAPAKLNLFLHVTGRRPDGYHGLQTVFRLLDWGDTLRFRVRPDGRIVRHGASASGVEEADDLAVRAARMLQSAANCPLGADIVVEKRIPAGGGFGGGGAVPPGTYRVTLTVGSATQSKLLTVLEDRWMEER